MLSASFLATALKSILAVDDGNAFAGVALTRLAMRHHFNHRIWRGALSNCLNAVVNQIEGIQYYGKFFIRQAACRMIFALSYDRGVVAAKSLRNAPVFERSPDGKGASGGDRVLAAHSNPK